MTLTAESTEKIVQLNGIPARVWEAKTEAGIPCFLFVTRIAVKDAADTDQFDRELQEHRAPSVEAQAFPMRMLL